MDPIEYIAARFEKIIAAANETGGRPDSLPDYDRAIFYLLSIRCEIDMNGFDSVFDQLLTEPELLFSIGVLERLGFNTLADAFRQAHSILRDNGFYGDDSKMKSSDWTGDKTGTFFPRVFFQASWKLSRICSRNSKLI